MLHNHSVTVISLSFSLFPVLPSCQVLPNKGKKCPRKMNLKITPVIKSEVKKKKSGTDVMEGCKKQLIK